MKVVKERAKKANPDLYRLKNNKDAANYRVLKNKTLTADDAALIINNNIKNYFKKINDLKQMNHNNVVKKVHAVSAGNSLVDSVFENKNINLDNLTITN